MMDASQESHLYHKRLDHLMINYPSESLHKLGKTTIKTCESGDSYLKVRMTYKDRLNQISLEI